MSTELLDQLETRIGALTDQVMLMKMEIDELKARILKGIDEMNHSPLSFGGRSSTWGSRNSSKTSGISVH